MGCDGMEYDGMGCSGLRWDMLWVEMCYVGVGWKWDVL